MTYHVPVLETRPARLATMPKLPIFLDLQKRRVILIGGGESIAWKVELLAASGARATVYAPDICEELEAILAGDNTIAHMPRSWQASDFDDAWLVIAACESDEEAHRISAAARSRGAFLNIVDRPAFCDFQFGAIVNRAPVLIGISTDGAAPILGQAIRRRIEAILPRSLGVWAKAAKDFRNDLRKRVPSREGRRRFWERFVDVTFISQSEEDSQFEKLEALVQEILAEKAKPQEGEVVIVGAGPGDPELLTMKAVRELQAADVIVYDRLVNPAILELGRREARRILAGKKGHGPACRQEEISALLVRLARKGQRVVRLKGGDPAIFGRTHEEVEACRAANVSFRIVPGITSASAAAAALGISLTLRDKAHRVQFVTGHDRNGKIPDHLDIDALADSQATTVVYMGSRTLSELARRILQKGLSPATPVVVMSNVARSDMHYVRATLSDFTTPEFDAGTGGPTLIVIGAAVEAVADNFPRIEPYRHATFQRESAYVDLPSA